MTDRGAVVETLLETSRKRGIISESFCRSLLALLSDDRIAALGERAFKDLLQKVDEAIARHAEVHRGTSRIFESCRSIRASLDTMNRHLTSAGRSAVKSINPL